MPEIELEVNQKVNIIVDKGPYRGNYLSKVAEIKEDELVLTAPYHKGELVPLRLDLPVKIHFAGETAAYVLHSKVLDRALEPVPLMTFSLTGKIERQQRRRYFRLDVKKDLKYRLVNDELEPVNEDFINSTTIDLSGGGVKIAVDEDFPADGLLELYLDLPEIGDLPIFGRIVNIYTLPDGRAAVIEFIEIDNQTREKIIQWLFEYQRKLRQKGLL